MYTTTQQCDYCREDMNRKCREAHPEWYDGDHRSIREKDDDKVMDYVNENTPHVACLTFVDGMGKTGVAEAYCPKHLRCIAEEIETGSCNCYGKN